jgi:hypothetical protein
MTETIKTLLQPIQSRRIVAAAPTDQARLLAAVQAVLEVADRWEEDFPHKAWQIRSALSKALTEAR